MVICALLVIVADKLETEGYPAAAADEISFDREIIARWPEACSRAGVEVIPMPTDVVQCIARVRGRVAS